MDARQMNFRIWDKGKPELGVKPRMSISFNPLKIWDRIIYWHDDDDRGMPFEFTDDPERFIVMMGMGRTDSTGREIFEGDTLEITPPRGSKVSVVCKHGTVSDIMANITSRTNHSEITGFYFMMPKGAIFFALPTDNVDKSFATMTITGHIYENK